MPERQVNIGHEHSTEQPWIPGDVSAVLTSEVFQTLNPFLGSGEGHFYGPLGECSLILYAAYQALEYEDPQTYLVVKKPSRLTLTETAVFVDTPGETQTSFYAFERDGGVSIVVKPRRIPSLDETLGVDLPQAPNQKPKETASDGVVAPPAPRTQAPTETLGSDQVAPWEVEKSRSAPTADTAEKSTGSPEPKKSRIDTKGRIGRLPTFKTTQRGKRMGRLPIAEHTKDETGEDITRWLTVAVFSELAESLEQQIATGELAVGDEVRLVGYPQTQCVPDGKGGMKEREVVFAAVLKKATPKGGQ